MNRTTTTNTVTLNAEQRALLTTALADCKTRKAAILAALETLDRNSSVLVFVNNDCADLCVKFDGKGKPSVCGVLEADKFNLGTMREEVLAHMPIVCNGRGQRAEYRGVRDTALREANSMQMVIAHLEGVLAKS